MCQRRKLTDAVQPGGGCATFRHVGTAGDDPAGASSIFTLPERPGALREGTGAKDAKDHGEIARLPNGAMLGRYVVTGCVGTGGMGVVYSARDPDLDRSVALKVLRPELSVETRSRARLLGEARAMAQLSHPNVVPVYDVGVLGDQVFIAMELVDGVTLRRKLDRTTPWRTVVTMYLQAARGLAAAHAAGLVHRDFKPDNVLFGSDGRIRVVDFGLVSIDPLEPAPPGSPLRGSIAAGIETTAGVVLGTPAFMAPEAMRGELTDPRADQFSFCVALFHGLYGVYPHTGATLADRAEQIARGAIKRPVGVAVPDRIYRILLRGLRARPEERHPSMEALVHALEHAIAPRRRRMIALGAGLGLAVAIAVFVLTRSHRTPSPLPLGAPETIARSDDQQLAVTMLREGRYIRIERGVVTVVSPDGASSRVLAAPPGVTPSRARASADGWAEVFATGTPCSWWLVPVDGGAWHSLLEDPSCVTEVDLSPDGTQLAITRGGELRVRNLATAAERTLINASFGVASDDGRVPSWSPDGKRIAVDGEVSVVDAASGAYLHHGRVGAAAAWLDADRLVYVTRTWLHSEIRVLDLRTAADEIAFDMEGNIADLSMRPGGVLLRRDEFHSRAHVASTSAPSPTTVDDLPQLDTASAIDFRPASWTADGAVITLSMVAGQRGLVRTAPGQRGAPLVLERARNITALGSTQGQILYSINDGDDCESRIFDLRTGKAQSWRNSRCVQRPYVTCAWSPSRCVVVDDMGSRWFDPSTMHFEGPAPRFQLEERLSPDATASVRAHGSTAVIRNLASGQETTIDVPAPGNLEVGWGHDASTLIVIANTLGHRRMLVWRDATWRTIIDEPHRVLNGFVVSPDGAQVAIVALLTTSTWSFLPVLSAR
jgi:serine/threonine protein kinase/WD40 repeat protein